MSYEVGRAHRQEHPHLLKYDTIQVLLVFQYIYECSFIPFSSELQKKYFIVSKMVQLQVSDMTGKHIYIYNISYEDFCPKYFH